MVVVIRVIFCRRERDVFMPLIVAYGTILTQQNTLKEFVENSIREYIHLSSLIEWTRACSENRHTSNG